MVLICKQCGTGWRWSRDGAGRAVKLEIDAGEEHTDPRCRALKLARLETASPR